MRRIITLALILYSSLAFYGQVQNPVKWLATFKPVSETEGEIIITATIEKGWHTYSQRPTDVGPISTTFAFPASKQYTVLGKTEESNAREEYDTAFEAKVFSFTDKAEFKQKIKYPKKGFGVGFTVEFVCCNDRTCLPPKTIELSVYVQ